MALAAAAARGKIFGAIARAEDALHGAVRGRYRIPLAPVGDLERGICRDLAVFYIYRAGIPEDVASRAEQARSDLITIRNGDILLGAAPADAGPTTGTELAEFTTPAPTFPAW